MMLISLFDNLLYFNGTDTVSVFTWGNILTSSDVICLSGFEFKQPSLISTDTHAFLHKIVKFHCGFSNKTGKSLLVNSDKKLNPVLQLKMKYFILSNTIF